MGEVKVPKGCSVPVGCVLAYAGQLTNEELKKLGWSICDGSSLQTTDHGELHDVIGALYGGDGKTSFNVPDYRGYFLRGLDTSGEIDKEADSRISPASGDVSGPTVGSVQTCYTARPVGNQPFYGEVDYPYNSTSGIWSGWDKTLHQGALYNRYFSNGGGDPETRPINAAVNFIIKLKADAALPTGVVIAFAGNTPITSSNHGNLYKLCDGKQLEPGSHPALSQAVGAAHGGDPSTFNLPDYRGLFLRGADNGKGRDPEAASRRPMAPGGASADAIGSIQSCATAPPVNPFVILFAVPNQEEYAARGGAWNTASLPETAVDVPFTVSGGDKETRPVNIYVDHYILAQPDPNEADIFPIGAVIGFAGTVAPSNQNWLECRGQSCEKSESRYKALYDAIEDDNGGGSDQFNLPNYEGFFLRGKDHGAGRDPDAGVRPLAHNGGKAGDNVGSSQGFATARPASKNITGQVSLPGHANILLGATGGLWAWGDPTKIEVKDGGDQETCPKNVSIYFFIKYFANS
jgi:microcystin-dependent protein